MGFKIENGVLVKYTGKDKDVVIPDGVISIGNKAFSHCQSLQTINMPNGVTNIGTKPTVSNACIPVAETHLLGFQGDLYGQFCRIELLDFLRKEQKFSGLDELKAAIADNIRTVQAACKQ